MQRIIFDALTCAQAEKTSVIMLDQYDTILDNIGREFEVKGIVKENLCGTGVTARILTSSYREPNHDALLRRSFALAETSTDLADEKIAILKGESRKWLICRVNLSTLGVDLVIMPRRPEIFQESDCNSLAWKRRHLRYMHFGSGIHETLLLSISGKQFLYQRQAIACLSNGQESGLIHSDCLLFDDYLKYWRLQTHYSCQGRYAEKSSQLWYKTTYAKKILSEK